MKTIFTTLAIFSLFVAQARHDNLLTISVADHSSFKVSIDNHFYDISRDKSEISNLSAGNHTIKIFRANGHAHGSRRQQLLYSSAIYIKKGYHVDIMINRFGKALIDEQPLNSWYEKPGNPDPYYREAMNATAFSHLLRSIKEERFERTRILITQQAIESNFFKSQQVKELLQHFSFDSDKLQIAKLAYTRTIDKDAFYILFSSFQFESSKEELGKYLRERR